MKKSLLLFVLLVAFVFAISCSQTDSPVGSSDVISENSGITDTAISDTALPDSTPDDSIPDSSIIDDSSIEDGGEDGDYEIITVEQALEICGEEGNVTEERYYLLVTVDTVLNAEYGEMMVSDATGEIYVYGSYSADGSLRYSEMEDKPYKGDTALLHCILQNFGGKKEVKNARIIEFVHEEYVDNGEYEEMSISEARDAAVGTGVKVSGVVARISYANGLKPNGLYLVDDSASIYVYSTDVAGRVEIGNRITITASKAYWILEDEQQNAAAHGYKGSNQLENATLIENDEQINDFDKSWIEEITVKELLNTPVSEDVTTLLYKTTALVKKVVGTGFTNYYFFDIDGETGAYTYTQCSGSDFSWIDEFDGEICTVYLCAMNAKSSATACIFRLFPVEIINENYVFNLEEAGAYAVEYHAIDKFQSIYNANPQTLLPASVSSELLGFENATLSYASDNENVAYFESTAEGYVFNLKNYGSAKITVTGSYMGKTYSQTVTVKYEKAATYEYITVAEAIATAPNTEDSEVVVKGIVGPSVVNKNGFYLFGEDGSVIAVLVASTDEFVDLEIGHEVILKGVRERYVNNDASAFASQSCLVDAEILVNNYGNHEYSTAKFVTDVTGAEFYGLDANVDYSTTVFVLKVKIEYVETNYYTTMNLIAEDNTKIGLYMSGAGQYSFLNQFSGQTVEMEIAACNWNNKTYWRGCVLAVRLPDGSKVYNRLNFDSY